MIRERRDFPDDDFDANGIGGTMLLILPKYNAKVGIQPPFCEKKNANFAHDF